MKKVLFASFLAAATLATPIAVMAQAAGGGVQLSQEEYTAYQNAIGTASTLR